MVIEKNKPILIPGLDWSKVSHISVTLEQPYMGGGLRWRQGTTDAKKNLSYNAHDDTSGPPFWPGSPIMYPEDEPAVAGDPDRDSFIMPAEACFIAFGFPFAPQEVPRKGLIGFTVSIERERVALMWKYYKMPPGDGTMHPPMNRLGPPQVPHVALRPLDKRMKPIVVDGEEVVWRPREFYDFDNMQNYDVAGAGHDFEDDKNRHEVAAMLQGFTQEEIEGLRELLKARRGK